MNEQLGNLDVVDIPKQDNKEDVQEDEKEDYKQETEDMVSKANAAAARLEKANKELAALIQRQEKMKVEATLSGEASAGIKQRRTKEEREIDNAREFLKGTGYEDDLFPVK